MSGIRRTGARIPPARRGLPPAASAVVLVLALSACVGKPDAPAAQAPPLIAVVRAADWMGREWAEDAIRVGLLESDLVRDVDYRLEVTSAQGDLATLPGLIDHAIDRKAAVIVALQDPTLAVALQRSERTPVIFHLLSDPFAAGAGTSDSNHLPNVTGVYSPGFGDPEQARRVELIRRVVPKARQAGVLFSPEEGLSVSFKDRFSAEAERSGLGVVAVPVGSVSEVGDATQALCDRKVDAIELFGNVAHAGFASLIKVANGCRTPVFSPSPFEVMQGATLSFFPDFQQGGVEAGKMIARVLRGETPASIPFHRVEKTQVFVNPTEAARAGVTIPADVVQQADSVVGGSR
ncbi:MAG TPA: ABC transporter substrate-binding protein [Gemmatimonadales bacterium]|nr:ABC transporter substrate-binding protein [Gemmatimonadales bacterium]